MATSFYPLVANLNDFTGDNNDEDSSHNREDYDDYHLHFEIQTNPYDKNLAGTYTFEDYLKWDWKLKNMSSQEILKEQKKIFSY